MYETTTSPPSDTNEANLTAIPVVKLLLVSLLRAGSILVQIATFPTDNVYNIISQNIIDIAVTITSFLAIGFPLFSSINDISGFFGLGTWIGSDDADIETAINGLCACLIGSHIITSLLSGRLHTKASVIIYTIYSGVILPITMHWAWSDSGWMKHNAILYKEVTFTDRNGGMVIHCASGVSAMIGSLFLGRRLLRLKDIDESSLSIESPGLTAIGYLFIIFGLIGASLPSNLDSMYIFAINSGVALSMSLMTVFAASKTERGSYWELLQCAQGGIATLVMLSSSAGDSIVTKPFFIAIVGSVIFITTSRMIYLSPLEDYGNIVSMHVINGFIAVFLPNIWTPFQDHVWQLMCSMVILSVHAVSFALIFYLLSLCGILRNENDKVNHTRSRNLVKNTKTSSCNRVFTISEKSVILQPGKSRKIPDNNTNVARELVLEGDQTAGSNEKKDQKKLASGDENCVISDDESVVYKLHDLMVESKNISNCV